ncbi:MAG: hypothetical protein HIU90_14320 [Proteobacteria bacterium]|nr:hypothetical protein [Pseudomonadota bacterium]
MIVSPPAIKAASCRPRTAAAAEPEQAAGLAAQDRDSEVANAGGETDTHGGMSTLMK